MIICFDLFLHTLWRYNLSLEGPSDIIIAVAQRRVSSSRFEPGTFLATGRRATSELRCTILKRIIPLLAGFGRACAPVRCAHPSFWAQYHGKRGAARPPPSQLRCFLFTLQNFPLGPNSGPLGKAAPYWATLHLTELSCTLLTCTLMSCAAPYWAKLYL